MSGSPKWKKVLISGSNFEVNHLTSSIALDPYITPNTGRRLVFASSGSSGDRGHFQTTGSINNKHQGGTNPNLFLRSESVNVPNLPISASTVANPIPIPTADPPLTTFPVVFKNEPHGGFEITSSIAFDPVLKFEGFQSGSDQAATNNNYIRTGSTLEGFTGGTLPIDNQFQNMEGQTAANVPFTFTGSAATGFYSSQSEVTYLDTSNGDFIEFNRAMPVGSGITASFVIPFFFTGSLVPNKDIRATLRRYQPGGYATGGSAEFIDSDEISIPITVFQGMNGWSGLNPLPLSASFSGSFEVASSDNFPIEQGERFQLRIRAHEDFGLGYTNLPSAFYGDGPLFKISGSTAVVGDELTGNFSGSFAGNVFGDMSSSLYGVTLNDSQGVVRGDGILMRNPNGTNNPEWNGESLTTMSVKLFPMNVNGASTGNINKSGLEVPEISDANLFSGNTVETTVPTTLALADGLPQAGLEFDGSKDQISVDLASNSGLAFATGDLKVNNTFLGNGLSGSFGGALDGSGSINLNPSQSGLTTTDGIMGAGKLALNSNLAGNGLTFGLSANDRSDLFLDTSFAVTGSGSITLARADSNPLSIQQNHNGGNSVGGSQEVFYNNNSALNSTGLNNAQLNINKTWTAAYTFKDDILIKGNFRVINDSNVTAIHADKFQTTDKFITLNSGSNSTVPFNYDAGGFLVQTSSFTAGSGSAIFHLNANSTQIAGTTWEAAGWGLAKGMGSDWHSPTKPTGIPTIGEVTASAENIGLISTVKLSVGATAVNPENIDQDLAFYESGALATLGSWFIDTASNPAGADSNIYIYGVFD